MWFFLGAIVVAVVVVRVADGARQIFIKLDFSKKT